MTNAAAPRPVRLLLASLLAPLLALAACGDDAAPVTRPLPELALAPDDTPSLRLSWSGGRALLLLVQQNGESRLWRSQGGIVVATEGARVTATAGLREWLAATRMDGPDPLDDPAALLRRPATLRRQVDLMDAGRAPQEMRFGLVLNCRLSAVAEAEELLVREDCQGPNGGFTNRYWADPATGGIWRSQQWGGAAGMLQLDVVTAPSG